MLQDTPANIKWRPAWLYKAHNVIKYKISMVNVHRRLTLTTK